MARYIVQHRYRAFSDGQHWGPWTKGVGVDLDEARAQWVNRDVPGTLVLDEPAAEDAAPADDAAGKGEADADADADDTAEVSEAGEADKPRNRKHTPSRTRS